VLGWEPHVELAEGLKLLLDRSTRADLVGRVVGA
jgi:hypothetical protein